MKSCKKDWSDVVGPLGDVYAICCYLCFSANDEYPSRELIDGTQGKKGMSSISGNITDQSDKHYFVSL